MDKMPGLSRQSTLILSNSSSMSADDDEGGSLKRAGTRKMSGSKRSTSDGNQPSTSKQPSVAKQASVRSQKSVVKQASIRSQKSVVKQASIRSQKSVVKSAQSQKSIVKRASMQSQTSVSKQASVRSQTSVKKFGSSARLSVTSSTGSLKKQKSQPGQRGKREIKKPKIFEFDDSDVLPPAEKKRKKEETKKKKLQEPAKQLLYHAGEYLALRSDEEDFYLGKAMSNVWDSMDNFRIHWLSNHGQAPGVYKRNFPETTQTECIITHVHIQRIAMDTYQLPERQRAKVMAELKKALNREKGIVEEEKPKKTKKAVVKKAPKKKAALTKKTSLTKKASLSKQGSLTKARLKKQGSKKTVATKAKKKSDKGKKSEEKKQKDADKKKASEQRARERQLLSKNPNALLEPKHNLTVLKKDPFLYTNDKVPFISGTAQSKLLLRAVTINDMKMLQQLIDDVKNVSMVNIVHSMACCRDALNLALKSNNSKAIQLLAKEMFARDPKKKPRQQPMASLLMRAGTGSYNYRSLGVPAVRALAMSRGSREGNNAFTKDQTRHQPLRKYIQTAIRDGTKKESLDALLAASSKTNLKSQAHDLIWIAVKNGNRKLAGQLVKEREEMGQTFFNALHRDVLLFDKEDLKQPIRAVSVRKKPWDNHKITPIHCAAINPNVKYLSKLFSLVPEYGITDEKMWRPIHYAAVCEGSGPLEFLLTRGQDPAEPNGEGLTPLMVACETGRTHNVELLLRRAQEDAKKSDDKPGTSEEDTFGPPESNKYGVGGVNRPVAKPQNIFGSYCPLHIAVHKGHLDIVKILLKNGAEINKEMGASKDKKTPLMVACQHGHLDIVEYLVQQKAPVEFKDKLKKTALVHAVMNGQAHVVSYLLHLGANPNVADTSGNTPLHYAAAYGWYHCLQLLLKAGANADAPNDWKVTSLGIAFLKGHIGLADILLNEPGVNLNFKDDKGMTLVAIACSSPLSDDLVEQLGYLVGKKNADCTLCDVNGLTPLHHLAQNDIKLAGNYRSREPCAKAMATTLKMAETLVRHGCDPSAKTSFGTDAVMMAVDQANVKLVEFLVERGGGVTDSVDKQRKNVLHLMAAQCMNANLALLLKKILKKADKKLLKKMADAVDSEGYTPLLRACHMYMKWDGQTTSQQATQEEEEDEDEEDADDDKDEEDEPEEEEEVEASEAGSMNDKEEEDAEEEEEEEEPMDEDDQSADGAAKDDDEDMDVDEIEAEDSDAGDDEEDGDTELKRPDAKVAENPAADKKCQSGRDFMEALVKLFGADVNAVMQKKHFEPGQKVPQEEANQYVKSAIAGYSAVHFLSQATHERPLKVKGMSRDPTPGLSLLLQFKPDLNQYDTLGRTPLLHAIKHNKEHIALKLVTHMADVNLVSKHKEDKSGSPLILAARNYMVKVVAALIERGAAVKAMDTEQWTPLHHAAALATGKPQPLELLQLLLKADKQSLINAGDRLQRTPLHLAVNANRGGTDSSSEVEEFLIAQGADLWAVDQRGRLPLHYIFVKIGSHKDTGSLDPIELCSTLTAAMQGRRLDETDLYGQTALHRAAYRGAGVCCMHLVQKGASINRHDKYGNSPLALAVRSGHVSCAIMLIQKGANFNVDIHRHPEEEEEEDKEEERDGSQKKKVKPAWVWKPIKRVQRKEETICPLFQEVINSEWQGVIYIILDLMDDRPDFVQKYSQTVESALKTNKFNLAMTLIRKAKTDRHLGALNSEQQNLFHVLGQVDASNQPHLHTRVAELLLQRGIPLLDKDCHGCTTLHYSSLHCNRKLTQCILENAAEVDVNERDNYGRSPLAAALWFAQRNRSRVLDYCQLLERYGAKLDIHCDYPPGHTALFGHKVAAQSSKYEQMTTNQRVSPLSHSINVGNFPLAKGLIQLGAGLNFADANGMTPIMHAVKANDLDIVRLLLNTSYKVKGQDEEDDGLVKPKGKATKKRAVLGSKAVRRPFMLAQKKKRKDEEEEEEEEEEAEDLPMEDINLNYKPFPKKSAVDLQAADCQGWTVLHHLVCPLELGSYDNVRMLKMLVDAGAPLQKQDGAGLTALDYAFIRGATKLAKGLQKLLGRKMENWERPTYSSPTSKDTVRWSTPKPNYKDDADAFLAKIEQDLAAAENQGQDGAIVAQPDKQLDMGDTGEVVVDAEQKLPYDLLLTKVDVRAGTWGLYNFYKMQVVHQKGKDLYILYTGWGRIGDAGQFQRTPYPRLEDCVKEFCKIFKSKSGNDWKKIKQFENKPKKYRLVQAEVRQTRKKLKDVEFNLKSDLPSKLPPYLQDLMKELTNVTAMTNAIRHLSVDNELVPFGLIKQEALLEAQALLKQIKVLVDAVTKAREQSPIQHMDQYHQNCERIAELSSEYFHLVPQNGYAYEKIRPLDEMDALSTQWKHVDALLEIELASKMLAGAQHRVKEMNPLDYVYRSMDCELEQLREDDMLTQYLLKYIRSSHTGKVEAIFRVARPGEDKRLQRRQLENHRLLFHGSSTSNLISILSKGLLVAPPDAPAHGYMFGKGIYTADMFSKSAGYCYNYSTDSNIKYMLICEVALGKVHDIYSASEYEDKQLANYDSVRGIGQKQPDPTFDVVTSSGAVLPLGETKDSPRPQDRCQTAFGHYWQLHNSEYIVYKDDQVSLRYIVQFK